MKKWSFKKIIKEVALFALLLFVFSNVLSYIKSPSQDDKKLPSFIATTIEGKTFDSSLHVKSDKPLLIHFWATWCPTCKMENSTIDSLSKKFEVITIVENSGDEEKIREFLKEKELSFQVINDNNGNIASLFKVAGFPTTFIYNKNGILEFSEVGYSSYITLYLKLLYANR
ncbi:redoxin domain-containing protein [bacterium]|nr:redoxin domain-containing protein [bacterium]MBU1884843.1 redoxin domain-containing protein [bacterium]